MNHFSPKTEKQLRDAGWFPGRNIDPPPYAETLMYHGFTVSSTVRDFFAEFGGLRILRVDMHPRAQDSWFDFQLEHFHFSSVKHSNDYYQEEVGELLCVIGHADNALMLFMTPDGTVYTENWENTIVLIADNPIEAIEALCTNRQIDGYNTLYV